MSTYKSPFPVGFLGVDLRYNGVWNPVGDDLDQGGFRVAHGARSEGSRADVSTLGFTVANPEGKYAPRNPRSPLSGLISRNTPARARIALGAPWLNLDGSGARASTPHAAALGITGDIDIRWYGWRDSWTVAADIMGKWSTTSNQRSWILRSEANGTMTLFWSPDGTNVLEARSLVALPSWAGRIALRATMRVNNGSGRTIVFYYSTSLDGEWTQLGPIISAVGTTSIYNSTSAPLTLGKILTSSAPTPAPPQRVYGWELRNGIAGTIVSSCTTADEPAGTSFADVQGRTWTVVAGAITNVHIPAVGEVAEWPMDWGTKGAPSVMSEIQAAGVTRRLGQGQQAVESVLYRAISATADAAQLRAYWPMEDGSDAQLFGAALGRDAMSFDVDRVDAAAYADFPASAPIPTIQNGRVRGTLASYSNTGALQVRWVQWTPAAGVAAEETVIRVELVGGTIARIDFKLRASGDSGVFGYDENNNDIGGGTFTAAVSVEGTHQRFSLEVNQSGANVFWRKSSLEPGATSGATYGQNFTGSQTLGKIGAVIINPRKSAFGDIAIGHVTAGTVITPLFDGIEADILTGHLGEAAATRMVRLGAENGVTVTPRARDTVALGEQQEQTFIDLVTEAAAADGGLLHDDPRSIGLRYRSLDSLGSQPAVVIPYTDNLVIPFETTDDDGLTRNRVTVERTGGSRATSELTTGPMSIQPVPLGVGLYDESLTLNVHTDDLAERTAGWLLHVGTWDEGRYPTLGVDLAHPFFLANPVLTRDLLSLTPGDRLVISNPPPWLPPRSVDVLVMGVQIAAGTHHVKLTWACVPARPYRIAYWNDSHRWSGDGTVLASGVTSTATALPLTTPLTVAWTHADGDYAIVVGGEVMTVTNVVGDTMTVTRSVNGVVKAHLAGDAVDLADPSFYAR